MADPTQPQMREVDVPTLLSSIAQQLSTNENQLNKVDGAGTHGQRVAAAFTAAAQAAANTESTDAGDQLAAAAAAMRNQGTGKAASFYADGLQQAALDFKGQAHISADNLLPFLKSFLGGIESNNPAKPGQGTMLDAIQPAVSAINTASRSGQATEKGLLDVLGAAIGGTQQTASNGTVDPGAASTTNVIGGIITAVAPTLISMLFNQGGNSAQSQNNFGSGSSGGIAGLLGGLLGGQGAQSTTSGSQGGGLDLGGLLGGIMGSPSAQGNPSDYEGYNSQQQQGGAGVSGLDLGGLVGGLMGSQGAQGNTTNTTSSSQSGSGDTGWVGGLLGGLMGGAQNNSGQASGSGGLDIGGLLGGLMGGGTQQQSGSSDYEGYNSQQQTQQQQGGQGGLDLGGLLGGLMGGRSGEVTDEEDNQQGKGGSQSGSY